MRECKKCYKIYPDGTKKCEKCGGKLVYPISFNPNNNGCEFCGSHFNIEIGRWPLVYHNNQLFQCQKCLYHVEFYEERKYDEDRHIYYAKRYKIYDYIIDDQGILYRSTISKDILENSRFAEYLEQKNYISQE